MYVYVVMYRGCIIKSYRVKKKIIYQTLQCANDSSVNQDKES